MHMHRPTSLAHKASLTEHALGIVGAWGTVSTDLARAIQRRRLPAFTPRTLRAHTATAFCEKREVSGCRLRQRKRAPREVEEERSALKERDSRNQMLHQPCYKPWCWRTNLRARDTSSRVRDGASGAIRPGVHQTPLLVCLASSASIPLRTRIASSHGAFSRAVIEDRRLARMLVRPSAARAVEPFWTASWLEDRVVTVSEGLQS